jgi:hypothetical protein
MYEVLQSLLHKLRDLREAHGTLKAAVQKYLAAERAYVQAWAPTTVYTQQFRAARNALAGLVAEA